MLDAESLLCLHHTGNNASSKNETANSRLFCVVYNKFGESEREKQLFVLEGDAGAR